MKIVSSTQIAGLIRARRKELGITQAELSDLAGVSTRSIFELENGNNSMTLKRVLAILEALGLSIQLGVADNGRL